jgi:hypothetical protein
LPFHTELKLLHGDNIRGLDVVLKVLDMLLELVHAVLLVFNDQVDLQRPKCQCLTHNMPAVKAGLQRGESRRRVPRLSERSKKVKMNLLDTAADSNKLRRTPHKTILRDATDSSLHGRKVSLVICTAELILFVQYKSGSSQARRTPGLDVQNKNRLGI